MNEEPKLTEDEKKDECARYIRKWERRISDVKAQIRKHPGVPELKTKLANYKIELQRWKNGGGYPEH